MKVFLLPGNPVSCLCAYDFFAAPHLRRRSGLGQRAPYATQRLPLARRISSQVGRLDVVRVRLEGGAVHPLAISGAAILSSTTRADGFVAIPGDSEGVAQGGLVEVHLYELPEAPSLGSARSD